MKRSAKEKLATDKAAVRGDPVALAQQTDDILAELEIEDKKRARRSRLPAKTTTLS